jgi:hypothetical protein
MVAGTLDTKADVRKLESCARAIDQAKAKGVELILEIGRQVTAAYKILAGTGRDGMLTSRLKQCVRSSRQPASHGSKANYGQRC